MQGQHWYNGEFNNVLFKTPAIADDGVSFTGNCMNVTPQGANKLVREFVKMGILEETTGFQRNRVFAFTRYLQLFLG